MTHTGLPFCWKEHLKWRQGLVNRRNYTALMYLLLSKYEAANALNAVLIVTTKASIHLVELCCLVFFWLKLMDLESHTCGMAIVLSMSLF